MNSTTPPAKLVADLCRSYNYCESKTGMAHFMVRLSWKPTRRQREAALQAGFRLLAPNEPI